MIEAHESKMDPIEARLRELHSFVVEICEMAIAGVSAHEYNNLFIKRMEELSDDELLRFSNFMPVIYQSDDIDNLRKKNGELQGCIGTLISKIIDKVHSTVLIKRIPRRYASG